MLRAWRSRREGGRMGCASALFLSVAVCLGESGEEGAEHTWCLSSWWFGCGGRGVGRSQTEHAQWRVAFLHSCGKRMVSALERECLSQPSTCSLGRPRTALVLAGRAQKPTQGSGIGYGPLLGLSVLKPQPIALMGLPFFRTALSCIMTTLPSDT